MRRILVSAIAAVAALSVAAPSVAARAAAGSSPGRCGPLSAARTGAALETLLDAVRGALPAGATVQATEVDVGGCRRLPKRFARVDVVPRIGSRVSERARATIRLVDGDGRRVGRAWLRATLAVSVPTVVAAHTIPAGTTLRDGDLTTALVALDRLPTRHVTTKEEAVGLQTRRPLPEGTPLRDSALDRPLLVRRGALVQAVVAREELVVYGRGIAQEDGRLGETIRVESTDGEREFLARVAAKDRVEVR